MSNKSEQGERDCFQFELQSALVESLVIALF